MTTQNQKLTPGQHVQVYMFFGAENKMGWLDGVFVKYHKGRCFIQHSENRETLAIRANVRIK